MIYVLLTYLFYPFIYAATSLKRKKELSRILVIQTAKIGDMICTTPVFRELKKKYPDAHLAVMIDPVNREILERNPNVDEIITVRHTDFKGFAGKVRLSRMIREGRYDAAVCLNPNIPYAVALFWGLVPVRVSVMPDYSGGTFRLASNLFTYLEEHEKGRMFIETCMSMLKALGINSGDISKEVYKSEGSDLIVQDILGSNGRLLAGLAISSGNKLKELGPDKITLLVNKLLENTSAHIVLIGSAHDREAAEKLCGSFTHKERVTNAAGKLSLAELPALIERLSLFIGVDSGITYMADALAVPLINVAGPADMQDQRPTGSSAVIIQDGPECAPCSHAFKAPYSCRLGTRECITSVSVDAIVSEAVKLLSGNRK